MRLAVTLSALISEHLFNRMFSFIYKHRIVTAIIGLAVLIGAWSLFRPELLFINKRVNEAPPFDATAQPLDTGLFTATSTKRVAVRRYTASPTDY